MTPTTHNALPPELPEPVAHRYWSRGHSSRWQLAGKEVPPDAAPLYSADQMHAMYARGQADARAALAAQVPVAWQYRYGVRGSDPVFWSDWQGCASQSVVERMKQQHDEHRVPFEHRPLYTIPPVEGAAPAEWGDCYVTEWATGQKCEEHTPPAGEARGEWLPIESAPRDGTRVLLLRGSRVDIGQWEPYKDGHWIDDGEGFRIDPDAWQPLPATLKEPT